MSLADVVLAAADLLDAAEDRMIGVAAAGVAYDHAGAEARLVVAGCLEAAPEGHVGPLLVLRVALDVLRSLPVPTGHDVLRVELRAELERRGERLPPFLLAVA